VDSLHHFREVWAVDFEFTAPPGHRPKPLCVVARELRSGRLVERWICDDPPAHPPYPTGDDVLVVAYYASAEWSCHLALGWPMPARIIDLYAEFANLTSGKRPSTGRGLLGALTYHGLPALDAVEKAPMRDLAIRGGPFSAAERIALVEYCRADVDSLARLLSTMIEKIDVPRALLRGRYTVAVARMESQGIPLDADTLMRLQNSWQAIKSQLIFAIDKAYGVFIPVRGELDPTTRFGSAIIESAKEYDLDPDALAEAAEAIVRAEREMRRSRSEAIHAARAATGLTATRTTELRGAGHGCFDVHGLDEPARELAQTFPMLGLGAGIGPMELDGDSTEAIRNLLNEPDPSALPRHHPDIVRRAVTLVVADRGPRLRRVPLRFSVTRWAAYLAENNIPWPRLASGELALDDDSFREMARLYPVKVGPIRELRHTLGQMRLNELSVGPDDRNRVLLSMFSSKTGRNQPSNSKFIFGPSCWLRSLIRPEVGRALAYVDWSAQELGIAAALSDDDRMKEAYRSGDPYLWFGRFAGRVPVDATKKTHGTERDLLKVVMLGVLYGLSDVGLARRLGIPQAYGRELLSLHRQTFRHYWRWSDGIQDRAILTNRLQTVFGWSVHVGPDTTSTSLRNFPMQAHGAEMMRLAACIATERGIEVCCPVHDAFLIEAPMDRIESETERMRAAMQEASELVLPGFPLRTDTKTIRYPDRYSDERGCVMWELVLSLLGELDDLTASGEDVSVGGYPSPLI